MRQSACGQERTLTFTMEDALISPEGFMILSGAGLIEAKEGAPIQVHVSETTDDVIYKDGETKAYIKTKEFVSGAKDATIYVMLMKDGEITSEPYIGTMVSAENGADLADFETKEVAFGTTTKVVSNYIVIEKKDSEPKYDPISINGTDKNYAFIENDTVVMVDYYTDKSAAAQQIEITPDQFGGNFYVEASTLFRDTNGVDMPAEFIIPNCKVQSNFTFTMASSGDPSEEMRMAA